MYTITGLLLLVVSGFLILQIPAVQSALISRYLRGFSGVTGFPSSVESFKLLWFDRLELEDVRIFDPEGREMIGAKKIQVNFDLTYLLNDRDVNIDGILTDSARVHLAMIAESDTSRDLNINVFVSRINEHYGTESSGDGRSPRINIGEALLSQSRFTYENQDLPPVEDGFNYNQFSLDIDEAHLQHFLILGDTIQFDVRSLLATDRKTKFGIKRLTTFFRISQQSMEFLGIDLLAGKSTITDTVIFTFNGQRELNEFTDKVRIKANLDHALIRPEDLALFAPEARKLIKPVSVSGNLNGYVHDFRLSEMEIGMGNTLLKGSLEMEGLPDIEETFIILNLKDSRVNFDDFSFVLTENALQRLKPIGEVSMNGQFLGYPTDFVAHGTFSNRLGLIATDINFKVNDEDFDKSSYKGELALNHFDLGTYLNDTINFQHVTLAGKVNGKGLTLSTADFKLNGSVKSIGIRNYTYTNITTNARFASELFNGFFRINDPNLEFTAEGTIDLRNGANTIRMRAQLDTAYLDRIGLTTNPVFVRSGLDMDIQGLHLDSLRGTADLRDFNIHYNDQQLHLANIRLTAERENNYRSIAVHSTIADMEVHGNFLFSDISKDVQKLMKEIFLNIRNDNQEISQYYQTANYRPKSYETEFRMNLKDIRPITNLLETNLEFSRNAIVEGKFISGYTTILQAYSHFDSIAYNNSLLIATDAELTVSKIADSTSVLAMAFVNSRKQTLGKMKTREMIAEAIWNRNHIDFEWDIEQVDLPNLMRVKGAVDFSKDSTYLRLLPSDIKFLEKQWNFNPGNLITFNNRAIAIRNLAVGDGNQSISVNGELSHDPSRVLSIQIHDLDLSSLNSLTGKSISGILNASFDLSNYFGEFSLQNDVTIDNLTLDDFLIGDISGKNQWDTLNNRFDINFFIDRNNKRIVNLAGYYTPSIKAAPLDVTARFDKANLKIIEPFFEDIFSNMGGTISGDYRISGKLDNPTIAGEGRIQDGQIMINYLKTLYQFTGILGLSPNSIYFKNFDLTDVFRNKGTLSGTITHENFSSMRINLDASFENFQVLNTTLKDNTLFYGQGYATGHLNVFGPISNLKFTAQARTDKNTRIFIPIGEVSEVEKREFIRFTNFSDSTFHEELAGVVNKKLDLTGITIDFNLDVTPDAYCEIIFDLKSGDIIRGRGNGELQLQLDTKGEFNMFGPFEFTEGWYNFTLYDIINKEFEIRKGSRITWYGDAYAGNLDISASYNQLASFAPIVYQTNPSISTSPQLRRKYPVQVLLKLDGPMLNPQINFDIVANELPQSIIVDGQPVRLDFEFQAFRNKLDEQELKRQVFSLIVLRKFSPPDAFNINTTTSIFNSVSEFLSNQLSNWASQVDENLEIDVDLSALDEEAFNTFQLRLSYTFLNGRLRVTRDGTFYSNPNNINTSPSQNLANIAGDWTVDYLLTADGKLKVKMYNRTNINPILHLNSQSWVTTGVSLTHTQSFNELRDIWRSARSKRKKNEKLVNTEGLREEDDEITP